MGKRFYRVVSIGGRIDTGVAGGSMASLSAIVKTNSQASHYCVANEYICAELGRVVGLPVPPGAIVRVSAAEEKDWFASLNFNFMEDLPPEISPYSLYRDEPFVSTGILLFDILVANQDRHEGNIARDFTRQSVSIFDHERALFGFQKDGGSARLGRLMDRLGITGPNGDGGTRHCLLDVVDSDRYFEAWCRRIDSIPDHFIGSVFRDAQALGLSDTDHRAGLEFIRRRKKEMRSLIRRHSAEFTRIPMMSLFHVDA